VDVADIFGKERYSMVASMTGDYQITVAAIDPKNTGSGTYQILAEVKKNPTAADQKQMQAELFMVEGGRLLSSQDQSKAGPKFQAAIKEFQELKDTEGEAAAWYFLGYTYRETDAPQAVQAFESALPLWKTLQNRPQEALTLLRLGKAFSNYKLRAYPRALECDQQALQIWTDLKEYKLQMDVLEHMWSLHRYYLEDKAQTTATLSRMVELAHAHKDTGQEADLLHRLANNAAEVGDTAKAISLLESAAALRKTLNQPEQQARVLNQMAQLQRQQKHLDKATATLAEAVDLLLATQPVSLTVQDYLVGLANLHLAQNQFPQALATCDRAAAVSGFEGRSFGPGMLMYKGMIQRSVRAFPEARDSFQAALNRINQSNPSAGQTASDPISPTNVELKLTELGAQLGLGLVQHDLGQHSEALTTIEKVRTEFVAFQQALHTANLLKPAESFISDLAMQFVSGYVYREIGEKHKALQAFENLAELLRQGDANPDLPDYVKENLQQFDQAVKPVLGVLYLETGRLIEGGEVFDTVTRQQKRSQQIQAIEGYVTGILEMMVNLEKAYAATKGNGRYATLDELIALGWLAPGFASGPVEGYRFTSRLTYDSHGYEISATPEKYGETGIRSFLVTKNERVLSKDKHGAGLTVLDFEEK
ncbi:MAG TPA: tetratricopeptide repeat protein, partial [Acidobacteriota bacterium]|nr:tetratricopeptide repeat protein [Acidobacteriota bacterium]